MTQEEIRLSESASRKKHWKRWGPYLSERAWGTVREDYSPDGNAWEYFPHDHARSRAYRWNEDGLAGISDRQQNVCFAIALWNERDPILKERLFGLTGNEGNHGEDVKEYYFYLDSTPTHSYMKYLYKYPQAEFPYARLVEENRRRGKSQSRSSNCSTPESSTNDRYFDVFVEYAKADPEDILIKITVANRGPKQPIFACFPRSGFAIPGPGEDSSRRPELHAGTSSAEPSDRAQQCQPRASSGCIAKALRSCSSPRTKPMRIACLESGIATPYVKDGINDYVVHGDAGRGKSASATARRRQRTTSLTLGAGETAVVRLRLPTLTSKPRMRFRRFRQDLRRSASARPTSSTARSFRMIYRADAQNVMRQGFAGMLWSKQFYHYIVKDWLEGDPGNPPPPPERLHGRNHEWTHLYNSDVISMPDKWEYPWYAAWDLAFHCIPLALVDPDFAKEQLMLMLREWYMHPNGQIPAYEWAFGDVNPPVHAWAAWRVYKIEKKRKGKGDRAFLQRIFHKLMLNFTWWVNRKDAEGMNIFQGGFLGLDNIGVFDRSAPLPTGGYIEQSDGTSWMAMYTLNLLAIALELASEDPTYEDVASKFWEHFVYIAHAMGHRGRRRHGAVERRGRILL